MRACMRGVAAALQRGRVGLLGLTKLGALSLLLAACSQLATLPIAATTGPSPTLSPPQHKLLPTVQVAAATGWPRGATPLAAPGLQVVAFAQGLEHPRWLLVLPNGDVLVAQSSEPPKPDDAQGIKGWVMGLFMKRAGAAVPSANSIALLRDTDGDGVADVREVLLAGLNSPFGMALIKDTLYVANTDAVLQFPYADGVTRINSSGIKLLDLPAGRINHHWTKNLIASLDGGQLYVTIGSNSNVAERGMAAEVGRAEIWQVDISTGVHRIFASGLRNPNGLVWQPRTGVLWTVVNERDELGNDLVPDYLTAVHAGDFYGWPYSYFGQHIDARVSPPRQDLVVSARVPDYALGAHTASLGLALANPSARSSALSARFTDGMFVGQHGSWNRSPPSGYKVIFVPFADGVPSGAPPMDVLTDFLGPDGNAQGRPVGVALDSHGGLLVADDVGNTVWRVSAAPVSGAMARAR